MRILFVTTAHNSLSQRLQVELTNRGHAVAIHLATGDEVMTNAVKEHRPDLIVAPMLKRAIPREIWDHHTCLIVHPGIKGDRGPSSLDWAIDRDEERWGVTVLQADDGMDSGPIWATEEFDMSPRPLPKSSLYRGAGTEAAVRAVLTATERLQRRDYVPEALDYSRPDVRGTLRPPMKQADRAIDWSRDSTAHIARKVRAADSSPGVLDGSLFGEEFYLYGAHEEDRLEGPPGAILAHRAGAVCIGTVDGAIWLSHLKARNHGPFANIKLPATQVLGARVTGVPERPIELTDANDYRTYREIVYWERRDVGYLAFDFYNGAMSTEQCHRLRKAYRHACAQSTKVIALMGGRSFFSNGHLHVIEAARDLAAESWANIHAINDLVRDIIETPSHLVIAALRGNAGAGGAMMALASDRVFARDGVVLNPHYSGMGGLSGRSTWTYTLPRRVGARTSLEPTRAGLRSACVMPGTLGFWTPVSVTTSSSSKRSSAPGRGARPAPGLPATPRVQARAEDRRRTPKAVGRLQGRGAVADVSELLRAQSRLSRGAAPVRPQRSPGGGAAKSGDIAFTCGMNMLHATVVLQ